MTVIVNLNYVTAYINDQLIPDVLAVRCRYALNQIPELEIHIPCGTRVLSGIGMSSAPIENLVIFGNEYITITVFLNNYLLFDGFVAGIQRVKSAMQGQHIIVITAKHWLDLLNAIPIVSESSHPSNPFSFMCDPKQIIHSIAGANINQDLLGAVTILLLENINAVTLSVDFWGGLRRALSGISSRDYRPPLFGEPIHDTGFGALLLSRIGSPYLFGFPPNLAPVISDSVRADIGAALFGQYLTNEGEAGLSIGVRLFSILLPNYLMDFVPLPGGCLVVPSWPSAIPLDGNYFTIYPDAQLIIAGVYNPQRPVRFSGVYTGGPYTISGAALTKSEKPTAIGGYYSKSTPIGVFLFRRATGFLTNLKQAGISHRSLAIIGREFVTPNPTGNNMATVRSNTAAYLADGLAYYFFCAESTMNRTATLVCVPHFNIPCPGTIVHVIDDSGGFFGRVSSVEITVSNEGQSGNASIGIGLSAVRNSLENYALPELYNPIHPWYGACLWSGQNLLN